MASIALSTALQDKDGTYNRLHNAKPITAGSRDPLNRTGHIEEGSPGTHLTSSTFKLTGAAKTKEERYFIRCRTRSYEQRTKESKPKPHQGHTFT